MYQKGFGVLIPVKSHTIKLNEYVFNKYKIQRLWKVKIVSGRKFIKTVSDI